MDINELKDDGLAGFVKQLGKEMQLKLSSGLSKEENRMKVEACSISSDDKEHSLYWEHHSSTAGNITLRRVKYGGPDIRIIGQVRDVSCKDAQNYPQQLRKAALVYEGVLAFLEEKFDKPTEGRFREVHYNGKIPNKFL